MIPVFLTIDDLITKHPVRMGKNVLLKSRSVEFKSQYPLSNCNISAPMYPKKPWTVMMSKIDQFYITLLFEY